MQCRMGAGFILLWVNTYLEVLFKTKRNNFIRSIYIQYHGVPREVV